MIYCFFVNFLVAQSGVYGQIIDTDIDQGAMGVNILLLKDDKFITGTATDFYGNYSLKAEPGIYTIKIIALGYSDQIIEGITIPANKQVQVDFTVNEYSIDLPHIIGNYGVTIPIIHLDETTSGTKISGETIREHPQKSINAISLTTAGLSGIHY